jgi:hypothetical protein
VPRCGRCSRHGHTPTECGEECSKCGLAGGAAGGGAEQRERRERNPHAARECPFNRCRGCGRVGHYTAECPGGGGGGPIAARAAAAPSCQTPSPTANAQLDAWPQIGRPAGDTQITQITQVQIEAQIEALMDRLFEKAPEIAIELLGSEGVARLTEALACGGPRAFNEIAAAADVDAGGGGSDAVLTTIERLRRGAAAGAPVSVAAPPAQQWGAAAPHGASSAGSGSAGRSSGLQAQQALETTVPPSGNGSGGSITAGPPPPPPGPHLVSLCDAVWPPSSGPHGLLKGALAKMLLAQACGGGGGCGWDGRVCWMPLALAGGWACIAVRVS